MKSIARGWDEGRFIYGDPPDDKNPVACYGQIWGIEKTMQHARRIGRPFWHIDNGFFRPGRGSPTGYYRFAYQSMTPRFLPDSPSQRFDRLGVTIKPWRSVGRHVLLALPGLEYGVGIDLDMPSWIQEIEQQLRLATDRPIIIRSRKSLVPLRQDLSNCWAVVTHSSNVAVDAVCAGIPVFVSPLSMAAPVGNLSLSDLENPRRPDRVAWCRSLACQQFTVREMSDGTAYRYLRRVENAAHSEY